MTVSYRLSCQRKLASIFAAVWMPVFAGMTGVVLPCFAYAYEVKEGVLESGYFELKECDEQESETMDHINFCGCLSNVRYPLIAGYADEGRQSSVNAELKGLVGNAGCNAEEAGAKRVGDKAPDDRAPNEYAVSFKLKRKAAHGVSLLMNYYTYGAGAAHGMTSVQGVTADLVTGMVYLDAEPLDLAQADAINAHIQHKLAEMNGKGDYAARLWLTDEKGRPRIYYSAEGCDGCTIYRGKKGWKAAFQLYSIASYADGIIEIDIPDSFIKPAIRELMN